MKTVIVYLFAALVLVSFGANARPWVEVKNDPKYVALETYQKAEVQGAYMMIHGTDTIPDVDMLVSASDRVVIDVHRAREARGIKHIGLSESKPVYRTPISSGSDEEVEEVNTLHVRFMCRDCGYKHSRYDGC